MMRWWRWDDSNAFSLPFYHERKKEEMRRWRPASGSFQAGLLEEKLLLYSVRKCLQRCCVWPMCVSVDKTCGSAQWKTGRTHLGLMKEGCQEGYQQGVAAEARRTRRSWGVTDGAGGKPDQPSRETEKKTKKTWHPQNSWTDQRRTVTESIIYFRTLDLSLGFLGR